MRAPAFWERDGPAARLLAPAAWAYARATARRVARPGWRAPVPVICCGNATAGGAGKTTLALDLVGRLHDRRLAVAFVTRGYGGRVRGVVRVGIDTTWAEVGDEALLLAGAGATFVSADRAAAARAAVAAGYRVIVMDDGLQNPTLHRDCALLVVDGAAGFGNGRVIPAGPLRETVEAAAARCHAAVLIGDDATGALARLPAGLPVLRARLRSAFDAAAMPGAVFAFAGIGRPSKFFDSLRAAGAELVGEAGFPDHHVYGAREVARLLDRAARLGARPVTTPKDAVRLPPAMGERVTAVGVRLEWDDEAALARVLDRVLAR